MVACLCSPARAGTYAVTYSGGAYLTIGGYLGLMSGSDSLGFLSFPYNPNPYSYGGAVMNGAAQTSPTTALCTGVITATFTWQPAYNGEPTPPCVVVEQQCTAVSAYGEDNVGTVNDGLGDSNSITDPGQNGGDLSVSRTTYTAYQSPAAVFTLQCNPSATAYAVYGAVWPGISYLATAFPVTIKLQGTTPDANGNPNILVGQGCTASLSGLPTALLNYTTYTWSVAGTTFQSWTVSSDFSIGAFVSGLGPANQPTAHWYWSERTSDMVVTCVAKVTPPVGQGAPFTITATQTVHVGRPSSIVSAPLGRVQINNLTPATYGPGYSLYAGPGNGFLHGISYMVRVGTPASFSSQGTGIWNILQLVTPGSWATPLGQAEQPYPLPPNVSQNGKLGLDFTYPYYPLPHSALFPGGVPANNLLDGSFDGPGISKLQDTNINYRVAETFTTYVMYLPPGSDVQWVPLTSIDWYWAANDSIPNASWMNWDNTIDAGIVRVTNLIGTIHHPQWTVLIH